MELLLKHEFEKLPASQRHHILKAIADNTPGFYLRSIERFERFGRFLETGIYEHNGREFVYVPAEIVCLGWGNFTKGINAKTRADLMATLEEYGVTNLEAFLRDITSPARTVSIRHMLVERELNEMAGGWFKRVSLKRWIMLKLEARWKRLNNQTLNALFITNVFGCAAIMTAK